MYNKKIKFSETNRFGCGLSDEDDVYTVEEFKKAVECNAFIDYDGYGYPVKNKLADPKIIILPSKIDQIPEDATHIVWFNR